MNQYYAIAAILALTLTGCASSGEEISVTQPTDASVEDILEAPSTEEALFSPNTESMELLLNGLMDSCDRAVAEGMTEVGDGIRLVLLPKPEGYDSYTAFYENTVSGEAELIFSLDFASACYIPITASYYAEGVESDEGIVWADFPIQAQQISDREVVVIDYSLGNDSAQKSTYVFENGSLIAHRLDDYNIEITYGGWTEEDKVKIKSLVENLSE